MQDVINKIRKSASGVHVKNTNMAKEIDEVANYYEFYDGKPDVTDPTEMPNSYGQMWPVPGDLDYKPTREVRNQAKKLIQKQARFMFGVPPTIGLKPLDKGQTDAAEEKRMVVDRILQSTQFWAHTAKAFLDATVGKRVLLMIQASSKSPIQFRYYKMNEFTYTVDPHDCTKLQSVDIFYQDSAFISTIETEQRWHRWRYEMRNGACWGTYEVTDGAGNPVVRNVGVDANGLPVQEVIKQEFNTRLSQIPCRVILNGGLTGDTRGESDIKDLMDLANSYNRVNSDYRDALRFKMFEQPVFIDADSSELAKIKIAPNSVIDLKTDPTIGDGTGSTRSAQATTLSSTFNFADPAEKYLDRLKRDMYELMDQPLPEHLANVPSAKALGFLFFDLKARCEFKWQEWDPAIAWVIDMIREACVAFDLYPELNAASVMQTMTNVVINHNYPIPEDEEAKRGIAIQEVQANVMSHKTYMRRYSDVEDEDGEWNEVMEELDELNSSTNMGLMETTEPEEEIEIVDGPTQVAGEGTEEDEEDEE